MTGPSGLQPQDREGRGLPDPAPPTLATFYVITLSPSEACPLSALEYLLYILGLPPSHREPH